MRTSTEEPFFFQNEYSELFGIHYTPSCSRSDADERLKRNIVMCNPFAEEKNISHRVLTDFARYACSHGYNVLRFDYRGCGDSEGDFEEATLSTRLSDIHRAIEILIERTGNDKIILFGLRLGATLAAAIASDGPRTDSLVLWEPVLHVKAYFEQFLRYQVLAEMIRENILVTNRKKLINDLQDGKCVDILGYLLSPECYREFTGFNPHQCIEKYAGPILMVPISLHMRKNIHKFLVNLKHTSIDVMEVQDHPFWIDPNNPWREIKHWYDHQDLFKLTIDWLSNNKNSIEEQEDIC
jgi:exosortase A-associated hydrolase 2